MISLELAVTGAVVLVAAILTGRWLWSSLHPKAGESPCAACPVAGTGCDACSVKPEDREGGAGAPSDGVPPDLEG